MEITSVKIETAAAKDDFRAYAHITFDNCFRVIGLRLFVGPNGYELFMPTKKMPRGEPLMLAYPIIDEMKSYIRAAVIAEYEKVTGETPATYKAAVEARGETRHGIEQRMDELARQYLETHDPEITSEMNELRRWLDELKQTA